MKDILPIQVLFSGNYERNTYFMGIITNGIRGGSRAVATSKMERFVIIVDGFQPLTIIAKRSILDAAAVLDSLGMKFL